MADNTDKQNSLNVTTANPFKDSNRSGWLWIAPLGTPLPKTPTEALSDAFKGTGFITEDGLTEPAAMELGDGFVDAGGETMINADPSFNKTWTGAFSEASNINVLTALYGADKVKLDETTGVLTYDEEAISLDHHVMVIDELWAKTPDFPLGRRVRHVMPNATILLTDDITHNSTSLVSYGFTVSASSISNYPPQRTMVQIKAPTGGGTTRSAAK